MNVIGNNVCTTARPTSAFGEAIAAIADVAWIARRAAKPSVRLCGFTNVFYGRFGPR